MKIQKLKQSEIENLMHHLNQVFEGAELRAFGNSAIAYGYLKQGVESVLKSAQGDVKYKFLRIIK